MPEFKPYHIFLFFTCYFFIASFFKNIGRNDIIKNVFGTERVNSFYKKLAVVSLVVTVGTYLYEVFRVSL